MKKKGEKEILDEQNKDFAEINKKPQNEFNSVLKTEQIFVTEKDACYKTEAKKSKVVKPNYAKQKLFAMFLCLCVGVAMIQTTFYIPIFSDIFAPKADAKTLPLTFTFSSVNSAVKTVGFTLLLENEPADYLKEDIGVFLVADGNDTKEFFDLVGSLKNSNKISVTSKITTGTFTNYLDYVGVVNLKPSTTYKLVVIKSDEIVLTKAVTTKSANYITDLQVVKNYVADPDYKQLKIHPVLNSEFVNYNEIFVEFFNQSTNQYHYSIANKSNIDDFWALWPVLKTDPEQKYQIKVYCSTDNPEDLYYKDTMLWDDGRTIYLIYEHGEIISF